MKPDTPVKEDEAQWRRRLGAGANNRAWALAEQAGRTPDEDEEMLNAAHAALHLWQPIGTEENVALGQLLLGQVHALLEHPRLAMRYAREAHDFFVRPDRASWEQALAEVVLAHAAYRGGDAIGHAAAYQRAEAMTAQLVDAEEQDIVRASLRVVPAPR